GRPSGRGVGGPRPQSASSGSARARAASGGVEGIVLMRRWQNPSEVLDGVHAAVEDLNGHRLPSGVRLVTIYDRTSLVHNQLATVGRVRLEGFLIVVVGLLLLLLSLRAALLTALVIPLSLLFALAC